MKVEKFGKFKIFIFIVGVLLIINLIILGYWFVLFKGNIPSDNLRVIFLDVGQGDAILIQTPKQQNILIDGGSDKNIIYKLDQYIPVTRRTIDLMIATHADLDHITGLVEVLYRYDVKRVLENGLQGYSSAYYQWQKLLKEKNILKDIVDAPQTIVIEEGILLQFLWPYQDLIKDLNPDSNFASVVVKLIYGDNSFLLVGDATSETEEILLKLPNEVNLRADVLKVGHHGSKYSSTMEFLNKVKPKYGIISYGKNSFGHPNLRVLKNLENVGAKILRTDQLGDIIFLSDGQELKLTN